METTTCPYCQTALTKIPKRKTKCLQCKCYIYVRTVPIANKKVLCTEAMVRLVDNLWFWQQEDSDIQLGAELKRQGIGSGGLVKLNSQGLQAFFVSAYRYQFENNFSDKLLDVGIKLSLPPQPFKQILSIVWPLLNQAINSALLENNKDLALQINSLQCKILNYEGRNSSHLRREIWKHELSYLKEFSGLTAVNILNSQVIDCPSFQYKNSTTLDIDDEIANPTLPFKDCKNYWLNDKIGYCNCRYIPVRCESENVAPVDGVDGGGLDTMSDGGYRITMTIDSSELLEEIVNDNSVVNRKEKPDRPGAAQVLFIIAIVVLMIIIVIMNIGR